MKKHRDRKKGPFKRTWIREFIAFTLAFVIMVPLFPEVFANDSKTVVEPTCTEPGQILTEDSETHSITAETVPALGHSFGEWETISDSCYESRTCMVCGYTEYRLPESREEAAVARLELTGDIWGINKKSKVTLDAAFSGQNKEFNCYAIMTLQGHSTLDLNKPNFTIRFYDDHEGNAKHKLIFNDWQKEHKYILKADYYDVTQCRNIVGARLWRAVTASRENLHPRIAALPTLGASDGFPVSVWLNGDFFGLYTMCLHKDDDLYGMEKGEREAILICNANSEDEAEFRALAELDEEGVHNWEMEFCGTEDYTWAKDGFNSLIDFVMYSSDEEFRTGLSEYLDVDAAIDYLIFIYAMGLTHSGTKDLVMLNYGDVWIPSAYDMDEAFGMMPKGRGTYAPDVFLPACVDGVWTSDTDSLLWDRLLQNYGEEIKARYKELRKDALSDENILSVVDTFIGEIPETLYLRDAECYPGRLSASDMTLQIHHYLSKRLSLLDGILGGEQS